MWPRPVAIPAVFLQCSTGGSTDIGTGSINPTVDMRLLRQYLPMVNRLDFWYISWRVLKIPKRFTPWPKLF
ncbi:hypothetical protein F5884DRAFT_779906 [Xylogone sp. PMI_703]|nr:hypothetical protein F5884DRAFT_779906 [Xylogone sp. PMI_703]